MTYSCFTDRKLDHPHPTPSPEYANMGQFSHVAFRKNTTGQGLCVTSRTDVLKNNWSHIGISWKGFCCE